MTANCAVEAATVAPSGTGSGASPNPTRSRATDGIFGQVDGDILVGPVNSNSSLQRAAAQRRVKLARCRNRR